MDLTQLIFGLVLVLLLVVFGGYYGWRQVRNLRLLSRMPELREEDRRPAQRQAWRRLLNSVLMLVLAGLLTGSFFLEERARELAEHNAAARERGQEPVLTPAQEAFRRLYAIYWIITLLVLLAVILVAAFDLWALRRLGARLRQQLYAERRAMIEDQVARVRKLRRLEE